MAVTEDCYTGLFEFFLRLRYARLWPGSRAYISLGRHPGRTAGPDPPRP